MAASGADRTSGGHFSAIAAVPVAGGSSVLRLTTEGYVVSFVAGDTGSAALPPFEAVSIDLSTIGALSVDAFMPKTDRRARAMVRCFGAPSSHCKLVAGMMRFEPAR